MQDQNDQQSEASSIASRKQTYHLLRTAELSERRTIVPKWLVVYLVFSICLAVATLTASLLFADTASTTIKNIKERLVTMSSFVELQYYLRANAHSFLKEWKLLTTLFERQLSNRSIPIPQQLLDDDTIRSYYENLAGVYRGMPGGPFQYSSDRLQWMVSALSNSASKFEISRWANSLFGEELEYLSSIRIIFQDLLPVSLLKSQYVNQAGILEVVRSIVSRSQDVLLRLKVIEPYMIGKEPPFNMPEEVVTELADITTEMISLFSNTAENLMSQVLLVANEVAIIVLIKDTNNFNVRYWTMVSILCGLVFAYILLVTFSRLKVQSGLSHTTMMYQLLKVNEAELHIGYYARILDTVKKFALDEASLIIHYTLLNRAKGEFNAFELRFTNQEAKTKKLNRISMVNQVVVPFKGAAIMKTFGFLSFFDLAALVAILASIGWSLKGFNSTQELYIESYRKLAGVNHQGMYYCALASLGNFIKIDGKYPEDEWGSRSKAIDSFGSFWVSKTGLLGNHLNNDDINKLNSMLYGNICEYLPRGENFEEILYRLCDEHPTTSKGIYSFLMEEDRVQKALLDSEASHYQEYLGSSRKNYSRSPLTNQLFTDYNVRTDELHYSLINTFRSHVLGSVLRSLNSRIESYNRQVHYIEVLGMGLTIVLLVAGYWTTLVLLEIDKRTALETLSTIRPSTLRTNPFISNRLKSIYFNFQKL